MNTHKQTTNFIQGRNTDHERANTRADRQTPAMFQYAKDYGQELMPKTLLDDIEEFIDGFVDGAPDASATSKTANYLKSKIVIHRNKIFFH